MCFAKHAYVEVLFNIIDITDYANLLEKDETSLDDNS